MIFTEKVGSRVLIISMATPPNESSKCQKKQVFHRQEFPSFVYGVCDNHPFTEYQIVSSHVRINCRCGLVGPPWFPHRKVTAPHLFQPAACYLSTLFSRLCAPWPGKKRVVAPELLHSLNRSCEVVLATSVQYLIGKSLCWWLHIIGGLSSIGLAIPKHRISVITDKSSVVGPQQAAPIPASQARMMAIFSSCCLIYKRRRSLLASLDPCFLLRGRSLSHSQRSCWTWSTYGYTIMHAPYCKPSLDRRAPVERRLFFSVASFTNAEPATRNWCHRVSYRCYRLANRASLPSCSNRAGLQHLLMNLKAAGSQ
ncbi:uncharacterized protein LY79DRAFT_33631 [Colletotrichum navitas]|uniref:Uncharacterized protein n=1 Tax=Colletotrichum navitas TaxID=681940 RepID=A0AAD8Q6K1_9PEZI|nr:uncharacterized protein LY79DRAFT_33631 [Colletotrichum navitas]KAK1596858.1 hypothetical protein LY79DRAFT_33631 [Colletotrichum navitas]